MEVPMKIVSATFIRAAATPRDYPALGLPELAFAGRSNVGKSSMINSLLARHNLVKTSKTPGHTRKLNFFLINEQFVLVDFPGYGYAQVPLDVRRQWRPMVETYLQNRKELAGVVVVVDSRMKPTEMDMTFIEYLQAHEIPRIIGVTKADKLSRSQMAAQQRLIRGIVGDAVPVVFFSARSGLGKKELWKTIKSLIE